MNNPSTTAIEMRPRHQSHQKKALCNMQEGTLVSSFAPPIIAVSPDGQHHIGFNASICRPPDFMHATANSRDGAQRRNSSSRRQLVGNQFGDAPSPPSPPTPPPHPLAVPSNGRTLRSATLRAVQPVNGQQIAGPRRLRSGNLLYTQPEYFSEWTRQECVQCKRKEPLLFCVVAMFHILFVLIHLFNGSGPATVPSNTDMAVNAHDIGTIPLTGTMEVYNIITLVITSYGMVVVLLQYRLWLNSFLAISMIHLVLASSQVTVFSSGLRLVPHGVLLFIALQNRDKITYTMVALDQMR
jgi:hypothetical protein